MLSGAISSVISILILIAIIAVVVAVVRAMARPRSATVVEQPVMRQAPPAASGLAPRWYPDRDDPSLMRYYDGRVWTAQTQPHAQWFAPSCILPWSPLILSAMRGCAAVGLAALDAMLVCRRPRIRRHHLCTGLLLLLPRRCLEPELHHVAVDLHSNPR
jgi:hypothetical protein